MKSPGFGAFFIAASDTARSHGARRHDGSTNADARPNIVRVLDIARRRRMNFSHDMEALPQHKVDAICTAPRAKFNDGF
jgi:hypothetical protein